MECRKSWATILAISFDSTNRSRSSLPRVHQLLTLFTMPSISSSSTDPYSPTDMSAENYLNHPTFGLLFRICHTEQDQELFSTLYAQRLFFVVAMGPKGLQFESISRSTAKVLVEAQMRSLRRNGDSAVSAALLKTHQQLF
jgi:PII interaction protein X